MRRLAALMIFAIVAAAVGGLAGQASAQPAQKKIERWAALTPDSKARAYFGWGTTREKANAAALRSCRRVSKTCAVPPGSTPDMNDVFAMMCCTNPRFACAVYPATTREKAHEKITGLFVDAHFGNCAIKGYFSARTGKRL
jgi:hypothetical protein